VQALLGKSSVFEPEVESGIYVSEAEFVMHVEFEAHVAVGVEPEPGSTGDSGE